MPRRVIRALASSCMMALCGVAGASELRWEGPTICNEHDPLSFQIDQVLGAPLAEVADVEFAVGVERAEAPFVARLRVTPSGSEVSKERVLTAADCAKLIDTLTVAVVLALATHAPKADQRGAVEPEPVPVPPPADARPTDAPPTDAPPTVQPPEHVDRLSIGALARLVGDVGSLPQPGLGASLGAELGWRGLWLQLTATLFLDQRVQLTPRDGVPAGADVNLALGAALACTNALDATSRFQLPMCAGVELGRLAGVGRRVPDAREQAVPWVAPRLETGISFDIPRTQLRFGALLMAVAPLNRDEFVLRGIGSVHRPSSLAGRASVGFDVLFE